MDWNILRRVCLVGFLCLLAYSLYPWALCTFDRLDGVQIGNVNEATGHGEAPGSLDTARADNASSFLGGFFGSFGQCAGAYPPGGGDPRQLGALGGLFLGIFFFRALDRRQYRSRVRKMSADYAAIDAAAAPSKQRKQVIEPIPLSHEVRSATSANHTASARPLPTSVKPTSVKPIRQPSASTRTMFSASPPLALDDDDADGGFPRRSTPSAPRPISYNPPAVSPPRQDVPQRPANNEKSDGPDWEWD